MSLITFRQLIRPPRPPDRVLTERWTSGDDCSPKQTHKSSSLASPISFHWLSVTFKRTIIQTALLLFVFLRGWRRKNNSELLKYRQRNNSPFNNKQHKSGEFWCVTCGHIRTRMRAMDEQEAVNRGRIKLMKRTRRQRKSKIRTVTAVTAQEGIQSSARAPWHESAELHDSFSCRLLTQGGDLWVEMSAFKKGNNFWNPQSWRLARCSECLCFPTR